MAKQQLTIKELTETAGGKVTPRMVRHYHQVGLLPREASINDRPITEAERRFDWPAPGPRPQDHPGLINSPE